MNKPLLTPYELEIMLQLGNEDEDNDAIIPILPPEIKSKVPNSKESFDTMPYAMDYYSDEAGPWGNMYYKKNIQKK